jgi:hypothetical protein
VQSLRKLMHFKVPNSASELGCVLIPDPLRSRE